MRLLRASGYKRMPWKNGGGETVEIAVFPPAASVDDFDWRISMATVASDGPFSVFSGIDRTLSILKGDGILLDVEGSETTLTPESLPFPFPADAKSAARLTGSAVTDLNVMTRRGRFAHKVERLAMDGAVSAVTSGDPCFLFNAAGSLTVTAESRTLNLSALDCAVFTDMSACPVEIAGTGTAYLISIAAI